MGDIAPQSQPGFEVDFTDKPGDSELQRALKRMARGEPAPSEDDLIQECKDRLQELRNNPPFERMRQLAVEATNGFVDERVAILARHQSEELDKGNLAHSDVIRQAIAQFHRQRLVVIQHIHSKEAEAGFRKIWENGLDNRSDNPAAPPLSIQRQIAEDVTTEFVREILSEQFPDGPGQLRHFTYQGKIYGPMPVGAWKLVAALWPKRPYPVDFSDLAEAVKEDHSPNSFTKDTFRRLQYDAHTFFEEHSLPFRLTYVAAKRQGSIIKTA